MSDFTITLTESNGVTPEQKQAGIAAALEQYNTDNPDTPIADAQTYVDFVMNSAAESYARQYGLVT